MRKEGLRKAVSDVVEGCSHARAQAILRGCAYRVGHSRRRRPNLQCGSCPSREAEEGAGSGVDTVEARPLPVLIFRAKLPDEIAVKLLYVNFKDQMEYPEARVRIFPNGTCDEFTVISVVTPAEQQISLDVVTALGRGQGRSDEASPNPTGLFAPGSDDRDGHLLYGHLWYPALDSQNLATARRLQRQEPDITTSPRNSRLDQTGWKKASSPATLATRFQIASGPAQLRRSPATACSAWISPFIEPTTIDRRPSPNGI